MAKNYWKKSKQNAYKRINAYKTTSARTDARTDVRAGARTGARAGAKNAARIAAGVTARIAAKIAAILVFLLFAYSAARIGIAGGNYIYKNGFKVAEKIDVENYKSVLNFMFPIIDITYNSGNVANPFISQVKKFLWIFLGFDLNDPVTILNTRTSYFYLYYKNNYLPMLALDEKKERDEDTDSGNAAGRELQLNSRGSVNNGYDMSMGERRPAGELNNNGDGDNYKNDENADEGMISFCYYEGEEEKLETPEESITIGHEITIQNMTKYKIDIEALLKEPLNINFSRSGPKILVYHTHATESYIKNIGDLNRENVSNWSMNPEESVVRVGYELAELLRKKYGYEVLHNGTVHDYPDYEKSYNNAYETLNSYLKSYPSIKVVLDIHRDGLSKDQPKLRLTTKIDGKDAAKIMFVVGTDARRPEHANWKENLKFALKLQKNLNRQHPGLARHIYLSNNVYNQNLSSGALIIEIGGDGNLLSECLESVKYLAKAIHEVIGQ